MPIYKLMGFGIFALFFLLMILDFSTIATAQIKIERALGQAIDAGIITSDYEEDYMRGYVRLNENLAYQEAKNIMIETLKLNSSLENDSYTDSSFDGELTYYNDNPRFEAEFRTHVPFFSGRILGFDTFPITVRKKTPYLVGYK